MPLTPLCSFSCPSLTLSQAPAYPCEGCIQKFVCLTPLPLLSFSTPLPSLSCKPFTVPCKPVHLSAAPSLSLLSPTLFMILQLFKFTSPTWGLPSALRCLPLLSASVTSVCQCPHFLTPASLVHSSFGPVFTHCTALISLRQSCGSRNIPDKEFLKVFFLSLVLVLSSWLLFSLHSALSCQDSAVWERSKL